MAARPIHQRALVHLAVSVGVGLAMGTAAVLLQHTVLAFATGWIATTLVFCLWTWLSIRGMDAEQTESHSQSEDAGRGITDILLLVASMASLVGVAILLVAGTNKDSSGYVMGALGLACVAGSWFLVHLLFTLRYARLYYGEGNRGVDIGDEKHPDYQDFAYLSFCLGMTYQVSDQTIKDKLIRRTVMRHTLLSYALGAVVLACSINLVVSLAGSGS